MKAPTQASKPRELQCAFHDRTPTGKVEADGEDVILVHGEGVVDDCAQLECRCGGSRAHQHIHALQSVAEALLYERAHLHAHAACVVPPAEVSGCSSELFVRTGLHCMAPRQAM